MFICDAFNSERDCLMASRADCVDDLTLEVGRVEYLVEYLDVLPPSA